MDKIGIGKILKAARVAAGISCNKMAVRLGTGHERIKALEEGRGNYGIDMLLAYVQVISYQIELIEPMAVPLPLEEKVPEVKTTLHKPKIAEPTSAVGEVKKKKKVLIEEA